MIVGHNRICAILMHKFNIVPTALIQNNRVDFRFNRMDIDCYLGSLYESNEDEIVELFSKVPDVIVDKLKELIRENADNIKKYDGIKVESNHDFLGRGKYGEE